VASSSTVSSVNPDQLPPVPPQRLALTALAACLLATLAGFVLSRLSAGVGLWFNEVFCFFGVTWAVTRWSGRAPAAYVRLGFPGFPALLFAAALSVANFFGLAAPINALSEHFAPESLKDISDIARVLDHLSAVDLVLFGTAAIFGAAFCEEFLFRGVVQQGLAAGAARPFDAVLSSALIFAVFHLNPVSFLALLELGLFFGLLYQRTGSLWPGVVAHATQNATALGLYFLGRKSGAPASNEELGVRQLLAMAGMGITVLAMLFLLAKQYPRVWGRQSTADFQRPRVSLRRAFAPWLAAGALCLLGWFLVDRRGVELSLVDLQLEIPAAGAAEPPEVCAARARMESTREAVRTGKLAMERYRESRRALAAALKEMPPAK